MAEIDWKNILHELAENIKNRVYTVIPRRHSMPVNKFKDLLDSQAQEAIINTINEHSIPVTLISEEGDETFGTGDYVIVADPVDGTTNLARGLPPSVTSISVSRTDQQSGVFAGIILNLNTGETYYAEKDRGAFQEAWTLQTAEPVPFREALVSMDISKSPRLDVIKPLIEENRHLRGIGCSAMSLCHVASGVLDAHFDLRGIIRATDISAGLLILREAGGVYTIDGELFGDMPLRQDTHVDFIAASSMHLLNEIQRLLG
ncbi:MAG: hypothetical protein NWE89_10950 [Candidatus Bathyarchaeota archaeon]|nr:hypothetical protein [Candidatus Bathyarchaeota archaeon]